jgi:hypothetical protein
VLPDGGCGFARYRRRRHRVRVHTAAAVNKCAALLSDGNVRSRLIAEFTNQRDDQATKALPEIGLIFPRCRVD